MNPCVSCGACCASLRVDFDRAELAGGAFPWGSGVPEHMVHVLTPRLRRMCGTDLESPRCVALTGEVGISVGCSIYESRPSPCREFDVHHAACQRARQRFGLPPLNPTDQALGA